MVRCKGSSLPTAPHGEVQLESKTKNHTLKVLKNKGIENVGIKPGGSFRITLQILVTLYRLVAIQ
jgi:hypothetical protein